MTADGLTSVDLEMLRAAFAERLQRDVPLHRYTVARIGGPAQALIEVSSVAELVKVVSLAWKHGFPWIILGGGANVLVSDRGVRGLVVINQARRMRFSLRGEYPSVWAESGANLGLVARQAAVRGLSGLEWAAGIPGTVGGAVVGNAGAHGGDMAGNVILAEILQQTGAGKVVRVTREKWPLEKLGFAYRSSIFKQLAGKAVVLATRLRLEPGVRQDVRAKMNEYVAYRRRTQPPGASMGSMFKNPPGDFSGRLIEAAGLKGARSGGAQISPLHANFFINDGTASAADIMALIRLARSRVAEQFGVQLQLEIELVGDWRGDES